MKESSVGAHCRRALEAKNSGVKILTTLCLGIPTSTRLSKRAKEGEVTEALREDTEKNNATRR